MTPATNHDQAANARIGSHTNSIGSVAPPYAMLKCDLVWPFFRKEGLRMNVDLMLVPCSWRPWPTVTVALVFLAIASMLG